MGKRGVNNTGAGLQKPDGTALASVDVHFRLVDRAYSRTLVDGWEAGSHHRVAGDSYDTTDSKGEFDLDLWPNDQLAGVTWYWVHTDAPGYADFWVQLPTGSGADLTFAELYELAGGSLTPAELDALSDRIDAVEGGASVTDARLVEWVEGGDYQLTAVSYDGTYTTVAASGTIKWPDGSAGTFTTDAINTSWLVIDAYHVTHALSGHTVTQGAVTRNADGNVTVKPALVVS